MRGFSLSSISSLLQKVKMSQNFQAKLNLSLSSEIFFNHRCYFRLISFGEYTFPVLKLQRTFFYNPYSFLLV